MLRGYNDNSENDSSYYLNNTAGGNTQTTAYKANDN